MKKCIFVILTLLFVLLPSLSSQSTPYRNLDPIQAFIEAMDKKGKGGINALKVYIKNFPDTTSKWTQLAYFNIAVKYYHINNYAEAVKQGEKRFSIGNFGKGEEERLSLVLAESYGLKSSPVFNKEEALKYINKAIAKAKSSNDEAVLKTAQNLKKQLSAPPLPKMLPAQKIKRYYLKNEFSEVISYYGTLDSADKKNLEIHNIYANALLKLNKFDSAINEFKTLYEKKKEATYAYRLGTIYTKKAHSKRNMEKKLFDISVNYFLQAALLYQKGGSNDYQENAFRKAKACLSEKYGYNKIVEEYNELQTGLRKKDKKNESAINKKKKEIRNLKKKIRRYELEYNQEAPPYMYEELDKLEKELQVLESGATDSTRSEKIEKEIKELNENIQKELLNLKTKVKKHLNL